MDTISFGNIQTLREELLTHPVYSHITTTERIKIFMKHHVFAVWDSMNLLKKLQQYLTSVSVPWIPRDRAEYTRLINEMVIAEECDDDGKGGYASHFELYIQAMDEVGADITPIQQYLQMIIDGYHPIESLYSSEIPPTVSDFVKHSLELSLNGKPHEIAAAFFIGREDVIPYMFSAFLHELKKRGLHHSRFSYYLHLHTQLSESQRGPLIERMLLSLCNHDPLKQEQAHRVALSSLQARIRLWDGIINEIEQTGT